MRIIVNDDKTIVFLNNKDGIKFNQDEIEDYFKSLMIKLENYDIEDFNEVYVYIDPNYGLILELINNELDYFFDTDIKVQVFKKKNFLYNINYNYINKNIQKCSIIYKINDQLYLKIKKNIDNFIFSQILEYSDIIYGDEAIKIENIGKKVNYEEACCSTSRKA